MQFRSLRLDLCDGDLGENARHDYEKYLMEMRRRFAPWLEAEDPLLAANALLAIIDRVCALLARQIAAAGEAFREQGGFTERMTAARLEQRDADGAPECPECGRPMRIMVAKKGRNAGNAFGSGTAYPECRGTRPLAAGE